MTEDLTEPYTDWSDPRNRRVAVDFDGPIHAYTRGWQDGRIYDEPTVGALEAIRGLAREFRIVVFTARTILDPVREWLDEHGFMEYIEDVTNNKPQAQVYIDDRAVYFNAEDPMAWHRALANADEVVAQHARLKSARGVGA
jgi:hypothetical protein